MSRPGGYEDIIPALGRAGILSGELVGRSVNGVPLPIDLTI